MRILLFISTLVALGQPMALGDPAVDEYLAQILELLKAAMSAGIPDLGIPPLDPFAVPHFDIPHIDESIAQVDVAIDNLGIRNLSTFETKVAHMDLEDFSLELLLAIPDLRGDADYVL